MFTIRFIRAIFFAVLLLTSMSSAFGETVMESVVEQATCNEKGLFYDHSKQRCTSTKILVCDDSTLTALILAKATNAGKWLSLHQKIITTGYEVSQCVRPRDHELVISYVKQGLWPQFKTVRVLTH